MKRLYNAIKLHISNLSIKNKILSVCMMMVIVPSIVIGLLTFNRVSANFEEQAYKNATSLLEQTVSNIDYNLQNVQDTSNAYVNNAFILDIFMSSKYEIMDLSQQIDIFRTMNDYVSINKHNSPNVFFTQLYFYGNPIYINDNLYFYSIDDIKDSTLYKSSLANGMSSCWTVPYDKYYIYDINKNVISLGTSVKKSSRITDEIGYIVVDIETSVFNNILQAVDIDSCSMMVMHNNNQVIAKSWEGLFLDEFSDSQIIDILEMKENTATINNEKYMKIHTTTSINDWKVDYIIPYSYIKNSSKQLFFFTIMLIALFCILSFGVSMFLSNTLTNGIINLTKRLEDMNKMGKMKPVQVVGGDEIAVLSRLYNTMIERIQTLLINVYQMKIQKRDMELKVLEGQISPHFLYNTLDTLKWTALSGNTQVAATMAENLSNLFRLSLNRGKETLSIQDEVAHVEAYISIQNIRMNNSFKWINNVDKDLYEYKIIKLVLQPIIENSLVHGIQKAHNIDGVVALDSFIDDTSICFIVTDNGIGMTKSQVENILNLSTEGYGVCNVNERLQLYYGDDYGLTYESVVDKGTKVTIRIKKLKY